MGGRVAPRPPFCRELVAPAPPACVLTRSEFAAGWASTIASRYCRRNGASSCPEMRGIDRPHQLAEELPPPSLSPIGGRADGWRLAADVGKTDRLGRRMICKAFEALFPTDTAISDLRLRHWKAFSRVPRSGAGSFSARRPSRYLPAEITRLQRGNAVNIGGEIQCPTIPAMPRVCDPRRGGRVATRSERPMRSRARLMKLSAFSHPGGALRVPVRRAA